MSLSPHMQSPLLNVQRTSLAPRSILWPGISLILGAVFVYAGVVKALEPLVFANDIEHFRILSWPLGIRLAFYLPWLEILCGMALITGRLRSGALSILTGLMVVFIIATVAAKARGINLDCGCFGRASQGWGFGWHLVTDLVLLGALALLWLRPDHTKAD